MTEHKSEESGGIILDEGTVVDRILGVWQVGRDTEDYSLFDARLFRAQGDDEVRVLMDAGCVLLVFLSIRSGWSII